MDKKYFNSICIKLIKKLKEKLYNYQKVKLNSISKNCRYIKETNNFTKIYNFLKNSKIKFENLF